MLSSEGVPYSAKLDHSESTGPPNLKTAHQVNKLPTPLKTNMETKKW